MPKIETLEELQAERKRLQMKAKTLEGNLQADAKALSDKFLPLYTAFEWFRSGKLAATFRGIASVVDLIVPSASKASKGSSVWAMVAGMVLESLVSRIDLAQISSWVLSKMARKERTDDKDYNDASDM